MAGYFYGQEIAAVGQPGDVDTTQRNPLGMKCKYQDSVQGPQEYVYLAGVAGCLVDDWVSYNAKTYVAVRLAADAVGFVAIAPAAILAANWGWFLINGFYATANTDTVAGANGLFIDGTTGRADDLSVAGDFINGALATGADVANKCPVHIQYPYVTNTVPA